VLYAALAAIAAAGAAAHGLIETPAIVKIADALSGLALFVALVGWVRANRVLLSRLDEPDAGPGHPRVRVVRSRRPRLDEAEVNGRIVRLDPEDRVILPYEFR
jgi:hypothetical protein